MEKLRRAAGFISALVLFFAGAVLVGAAPIVGLPIMLVGLAASVWQGWKLWQRRLPPTDPYDLSRLWDEERLDDDPEDVLMDANGTLYCHHCGHAVPDPYARCPECGSQLR
jgi:hypothetical protein